MEIIKGPLTRLQGTDRELRVDDALIDALLVDIEVGAAKDALPLLSFTLERLYSEYHATGRLFLSHYEQLGRVKGSIEAAVERSFKAADADPAVPRDRQARLSLLRRGLIPWLASIDPDTGTPRRRVARFSEIPPEARPLMQHLVEQRLLTTDVARETGELTIEPVHEALLRQWGLLQGWLAEDAGLLGVLDDVKRASRDWVANRKAEAWLVHRLDRLANTDRLIKRADLAANLEPTDLQYLEACRKAERSKLRVTSIKHSYSSLKWSFVGVLITTVLAVGYSAYQFTEKSRQDRARLAGDPCMGKICWGAVFEKDSAVFGRVKEASLESAEAAAKQLCAGESAQDADY